MSESQTDTGSPVTHEAPLHNPDHYRPPAEPVKTYGPGPDGAREAGRDLAESRAKPASIKVWRDDDESDDLKGLSPHAAARKQASKITISRRIADGERLAQAAGVRSGSAAEFVGATVRDRAQTDGEPTPIKYQDGRPKDQPVTARQAAADLAAYRTQTAPQEAAARDEQFKQIVELLNGDEELARQTLGEQQTEQPAEPAPQPEQQPDPVEQQRQQTAAYLQAAQQLHGMTQGELIAKSQIEQALAIHQREFADVHSYEDAARMAPDRQQRFLGQQQALRTAHEQFQQLSAQRQLTQQQIETARQAEQEQAFQRYRAEQNAAAEKAVPELAPNADPAESFAFRKAATGLLEKHLGITPQNARSLSPEIQRALHHSGFAEIIAKAVRFDQAQARAHEVSAKQLPPVQRPGVSQPKGSRGAADLASLDRKIDTARQGSATQIRAAARLLAESRRTAQRGR